MEIDLRAIFATIFLILSFLGYSLFIKNKFKINTYFLPFLIFTSYISLIYVFAQLALMKEFVIISNVIGLILFVRAYRNGLKLKWLLPEYIIFFVIIGIIGLVLNGKHLYVQDDFGHWGVLARLLLRTDHLNTVHETRIDYTAYPQASAYFIYGLVRLIGYSESRMLVANAILVISGVFCLFSSIKDYKKDIVKIILLVVLGVFACFYDIRFQSLRVDTVIATTAFGIFAYIYYTDVNNYKNLYFAIPMFVSLVLVKTSAILFASVAIAYLFIKYYRVSKKLVFVNIAALLMAFLSWKNHVKYNFSLGSKHAVSVNRYEKIFEQKDRETIIKISREFLKRVGTDYFIIGLIILLILIYLIYNRDKIIRNLIMLVIFFYAIYQLGNYFTYIFSMDVGEALRLESYDRYIRTTHIYLVMISIYILSLDYNINNVLNLLFGALLIFTCYFSELIAPSTQRQMEAIEKFNRMRDEEEIPPGKRILVKFKERDNSRLYTRIVMFTFDTSEVKDTFVGDEKQFNKEDFDYIIEE